MPKNYFVNEGNHVGGQEPQAIGTAQTKITASAAVTKGQVVEVTGAWTVGPASDKSAKVVGIAFSDAAIDAQVVVETEGFVKLDATAAAITAGDKLVSGGEGKVRKMAASGDEAADVIGVAYSSCDASGVVYTKVTL